MGKKEENVYFRCIICLKEVFPLDNGSYRNHCPFCLMSLHVDCKPGDRMNGCKGLMLPISLVFKRKKGWQIVHKCLKCGEEHANKIAENCTQPDDLNLLIKLMNGTYN